MLNAILSLWLMLLLLPSLAVGQTPQRGLRKVQLSSGQEVTLYSRSYALVIGVQSYTHWDRLINPIRDAHDVGVALKQQGFEVAYLDDPDSDALKAGLNAFAYGDAGQAEDGRVVVFFAGHGHTEGVSSGQRGFILPRDVPRPEEDKIGFMTKAISMDFVEELATGMLAKHVLFIFDSCFSGTLLRGNAHPKPITEKTTKRVRQFVTSGSADEQVPDVSIFKASLLNALDGDADQTGDGYVTGEELGWYLKGKVMEYSNGSQTPQYGKIKDPNLDQGDMVFVLGRPIITTSSPESITPPPTLSPSRLNDRVFSSSVGQLAIISMNSKGEKDDTMDSFTFTIDEDHIFENPGKEHVAFTEEGFAWVLLKKMLRPGKEHVAKPKKGFMGVLFREIPTGPHTLHMKYAPQEIGGAMYASSVEQRIEVLPEKVFFLKVDIKRGNIVVESGNQVDQKEWEENYRSNSAYRREILLIDWVPEQPEKLLPILR